MKTPLLIFPALALGTAAFAAPISPTQYVASAGASDLYERQSSQLVLQSTADPKVKSFASMMLTAHAKSTADVKAAAAKSKVKAPPPKLMPAQAEMIAQLRAATGPARDSTYISQQKMAHGDALTLQQSYAAEGTAPALKATASKIVPVVQHHIEMLNAM